MKKLFVVVAALTAFASCVPKTEAAPSTPAPVLEASKTAPAPNSPKAAAQANSRYAALERLGFTVFPQAEEVPPFELAGVDGKKKSVTDFEGKFVLLNFWATWCPPCRQEMPSLSDLHEKYADTKLEVFAISVREDEKTVKAFLADKKYAFPVALDPDGEISKLFVGSGIPTTYVLDPEGNAIAGMVGGREWNTREAYEVFDSLPLD